MSNDTVFLFDISAYLHRAMYVTYGDRVAEVDPGDTAFIKHVCVMLSNTMTALNVKRMVVVCDSTEPLIRCELFPAYKAGRKAHYPVFSAQAPVFYDALRDVSVSVIVVPGYEADDLIATLVPHCPSAVIVSSDKDLLGQVVIPTRYYDPMKAQWFTGSDVVSKFGVLPTQLYDYIGLVGDSADGIPGVAGVGAKTAAKLLREFLSLDEVYAPDRHVALTEFCTKGQVEKLLAGKSDAFLSRALAMPMRCPWLGPAYPIQSVLDHAEAPSPAIVRGACG